MSPSAVAAGGSRGDSRLCEAGSGREAWCGPSPSLLLGVRLVPPKFVKLGKPDLKSMHCVPFEPGFLRPEVNICIHRYSPQGAQIGSGEQPVHTVGAGGEGKVLPSLMKLVSSLDCF